MYKIQKKKNFAYRFDMDLLKPLIIKYFKSAAQFFERPLNGIFDYYF